MLVLYFVDLHLFVPLGPVHTHLYSTPGNQLIKQHPKNNMSSSINKALTFGARPKLNINLFEGYVM